MGETITEQPLTQELVDKALELWKSGEKTHGEIKIQTGLSDAVEYAITVLNVTNAEVLQKLKPGMTSEEIKNLLK